MYERTGIQFLEIQNVQLADSGIYTCTVVNSAGKASVSAELTVQGTAVCRREKSELETFCSNVSGCVPDICKKHSLLPIIFSLCLSLSVH